MTPKRWQNFWCCWEQQQQNKTHDLVWILASTLQVLHLICHIFFKIAVHSVYLSVVWHLYSIYGEGNGNPLQYSCLENPRDRGAWWAAICGVAQSWTWLKRLSSSSSTPSIYLRLFLLKCWKISERTQIAVALNMQAKQWTNFDITRSSSSLPMYLSNSGSALKKITEIWFNTSFPRKTQRLHLNRILASFINM